MSTDAEYEALRTGTGLVKRGDWHLRRFSGEDRLTFLHKYCTQEVRIDPGQGTYGCILTVKGAMLGDLWVYVREEDLLVVTSAAAAEGLYKHLGKYALFDKVEMHDLTGERTLCSLWGPEGATPLRVLLGEAPPQEPLTHRTLSVDGAEVFVARNDFLDTPGWDLILPAGAENAITEILLSAGATAVGPEAADQARVEAGVPLYGVDMSEKTIPIEAGLEARAISYDKGCYTGQEVIARIAHRGRVNRHLLGVRLDGQVCAPVPLLLDGKEVGTLTSVARSPRLAGTPIGIGLIHRKAMEPGTTLEAGSGGPTGTVCALPFSAGSATA